MDMTYQASSGIYIMLSLALALQEWTKGISAKVAIHKIAASAGSYIAAMLVFRIAFMKKATDYATTQTAPFVQMPQTLMQNMQQYFSVLRADLNHSVIVLLLLILLTVLATIIWESARNKLQTGIVAGSVILLQAVFSYGGYLFLAKPLMAPRGIYGFGIFIIIVMIMGLSYAQKNYLLKLEAVILAWCMIVLSLTYGNALAEQKRYTEFRIQMVLEDYNHLTQDKPQQERWIQLDGNIGKTESIHRMEKKNPALKRLVPSTLGEKWYWNKHRFFHYYNLKAKSWDEKEKGDMKNMNLPVIIDSEYHKIQSDGTHILITLHE